MDKGELHSAAISTSPDNILRDQLVSSFQSFSASNQESGGLGQPIRKDGNTKYIYVRVKNRGKAVADLEQCALENYQQLIELYTQHKHPETNLKEMTAWAYYGVGNIYKSRGQWQEAQKMYEQGLKLTTDPDLIQRMESNVKEVKS